ncbi:MAG: sialate O-acetylesterase [Candidatus Izemoplasmatales bacterium]
MRRLLAFALSALVLALSACVPGTTLGTTTASTTIGTPVATTTTLPTALSTTVRTTRADETSDIALDFDLSQYDYLAPTVPIALPSIFADHLVFQRNKPIRVFGTGTPGGIALAKLVLAQDPSVFETAAAIVAADGTFALELAALPGSFDAYVLTVSDTVREIRIVDVLVGEVWIAGGQSNMAMTVREADGGVALADAADDSRIRIFDQAIGDHDGSYPSSPAADVAGGAWTVADSAAGVLDCSAIGYAFARELKRLLGEEHLDMPVAILNTAKGGSYLHSWLPRETMQASEAALDRIDDLGWTLSRAHWNEFGWDNYNQPSALYNQKIAPLLGFAIGGVLWYQGESDPVYDASLAMIPLLIESWSAGFNRDGTLLPFAMIQLAPYDGADPTLGPAANPKQVFFAYHRQAQLEVLMDPRYAATTVLVPIHDVSLAWNVPAGQFAWADPIHPVAKIPVGERAGKEAYTAFFYGAVDFLPPTVASIAYDATTITIAFDHVARGLRLIGSAASVATVEVILKNGIRTDVACTILDKDEIRIEGIDTTQVAAVAYGYRSRNEDANLASGYGIPALPFRLPLA